MTFRSTLLTMRLATLVLGVPGLCPAQPATSDAISIGQRFQLRSEIIGETRSYFVHRPANYDLSNARYPVLILLDGESHFQHASTTADLLADADRIPSLLVVGIPNTDRNRDLIPPESPAPNGAPASGAENFLKFITAELIPKLDRDFRTQPYRILVGHSNGGIFGLYSLMSAPGAFKGYILASPVAFPETIGSFLEEHGDSATSVYLTNGNETDLLSGNWELASHLQNQAQRDSRWSFAFRHYPEESHGTIPLRSVYDGLEFLFEGWEVEDGLTLYEQGGLPAIEKHYAALSSRFGFAVPISGEMLVGTTIGLYREQRIDEAEQLILRTIELYPNLTNALLTAGRLYFDKGDRAKATEYLTKALLLAPTRRAFGVDYAALSLDPQAVVPTVEVATADLEKSVGVYGSSTPALEIVRRGTKLYAVTADGENELTALSATRFYFTNGADVIAFQRDARGRVVGLVLQNRVVELARMR